ncbi:MAG: YraN family protein [Clostridia bacterium]|nr:YraN family protein [Clostridia bacterium]
MNKHLLGAYGEVLASRYLRFHGYELVTAHFNCRLGEIDLIVEDKKHICFVEVKTRSENLLYSPADAVDFSKRNKIIATSNIFLKDFELTKQPRFDIVEVYFKDDEPVRINHIEDAFDSLGQ